MGFVLKTNNKEEDLYEMISAGKIKPVASVGNLLPRQCGIATVTTDLYESPAVTYTGAACISLTVNDTEEGVQQSARGTI